MNNEELKEAIDKEFAFVKSIVSRLDEADKAIFQIAFAAGAKWAFKKALVINATHS